MPLAANAMIPDSPTYAPHPKHRNASPGESQWTISPEEEHTSFEAAWNFHWCEDGKGWGLHCVDGEAKYLGVIEDHETRTFVAKFVSDASQQNWHGYPADQRKRQDRPAWPLLRRWIYDKVLPDPKIRKIGRGQRCIL